MAPHKIALLIDHPGSEFVLGVVLELVKRGVPIHLVASAFPIPALLAVLALTRAYRPPNSPASSGTSPETGGAQTPSSQPGFPAHDGNHGPRSHNGQSMGPERSVSNADTSSAQRGEPSGLVGNRLSDVADTSSVQRAAWNQIDSHSMRQTQIDQAPDDVEHAQKHAMEPVRQSAEFAQAIGEMSDIPNAHLVLEATGLSRAEAMRTVKLLKEFSTISDDIVFANKRDLATFTGEAALDKPSGRTGGTLTSLSIPERVKRAIFRLSDFISKWSGRGRQARLTETINALIKRSLSPIYNEELAVHELIARVYKEQRAPELLLLGQRHDDFEDWRHYWYRYVWFQPSTLITYKKNLGKPPEGMLWEDRIFCPMSKDYFPSTYSQIPIALQRHSHEQPLRIALSPDPEENIALTGWWDELPSGVLHQEIKCVYGSNDGGCHVIRISEQG
jgi:hypothetical protein